MSPINCQKWHLCAELPSATGLTVGSNAAASSPLIKMTVVSCGTDFGSVRKGGGD